MDIKRPKLHPLAGSRWTVFLKGLTRKGLTRESRIQRATGWAAQVFRSPFTLYDALAYRSKLAKMEEAPAPIFVLGYWRSGTTHLHNILAHSDQFGFLKFGQSLLPLEILSPRVRLSRLVMSRNIPKTRHLDGMKLNLDVPQEEEFALGNLGLLSNMYCYYFPSEIEEHTRRALFFEDVSEREVQQFKDNYRYLINKLSMVEKGRQLVLKNPASTLRVAMLKELFPGAKFIHIVRNPWEVFASNIHKFAKLNRVFAWQSPGDFDYGRYVLDLYPKFMRRFLENHDEQNLAHSDFIEVRFEDLIADPLSVADRIYDQLSLPQSEQAHDNISDYLDSMASYSKNRHFIESSLIPEVESKWQFAFEQWGYDTKLPDDIDVVDG